MTAREMAHKAKSFPIGMVVDVVFSNDEFKAFINQLCKEQRENCAKMVNRLYPEQQHKDEMKILNAKQPEV